MKVIKKLIKISSKIFLIALYFLFLLYISNNQLQRIKISDKLVTDVIQFGGIFAL